MSTFYIILSVLRRGDFAQTASVVMAKTNKNYFCSRSVEVKRERGCRDDDVNGFSRCTRNAQKSRLNLTLLIIYVILEMSRCTF